MKLVHVIVIGLVIFVPVIIINNKIAKDNNNQDSIQKYVDSKVNVVVIDNCQYIATQLSPLVITHKGNCTNCIHK